jgi:hypothetical protein
MSTPFTTDDAKQMLKEILASTTDLQKRMVAQKDRLETLSDEVPHSRSIKDGSMSL